MKLYHHPLSTFSRRIRMQLIEKGVSIDEVLIDMTKAEHKGPAYKTLNPYGRVPLLVDGSFVLYESSAIMDYLETVFPEPPLLPQSAQSRALVAMHIKLCDVEFGSQTRSVIFPRRFFPRERWDVPSQEKAIDGIAKHLGILEAQLTGKSYLVDDRYTLADLAYTPFVQFLPLLELTAPPNVARWIARIEARPSAQQTRPPK
ncbi:MAG: glutathione S-transferase family protein [Myxococcales bacterium]